MPIPFKVVFFGSNNAGATPRQIFKPSLERKVPDRNAFLVNTHFTSRQYNFSRLSSPDSGSIQIFMHRLCPRHAVQECLAYGLLHPMSLTGPAVHCTNGTWLRYTVCFVNVLSFKEGGNFVEVRTIWQES